jgi:hypothetical protein
MRLRCDRGPVFDRDRDPVLDRGPVLDCDPVLDFEAFDGVEID